MSHILDSHTRRLAALCQMVYDLRDELYEAEAEYTRKAHALPEYNRVRVLDSLLSRTNQRVAEAQDFLREVAVRVYERDGELSYDYGSIANYTVLDYTPTDALEWAKKSGLALSLDKKAFEKIVKASPDSVDFVTISLDPRYRIASDLSPLLDGEDG